MSDETRRYLRRIGLSWYVRIAVPRPLQAIVKNTHITRALHTRDLDVANQRKWPMIESIKAELSRLKGRSPEREKADEFRARLRELREAEDYDQAEVIEDFAYEHAGTIGERMGDAAAHDWIAIATATDTKTLLELREDWLAAPGTHYTAQTKQQHRHAVQSLCQALPVRDGLPKRITDTVAVDYVENTLKLSGKAYATQRRQLNSLVAFWSWMGLRGYVPRNQNPWSGFKLSKRHTPKQTETKRSYTSAELVKLFSLRPHYPGLGDLMTLGLLTGARIEELAGLRVGDIRAAERAPGVFLVAIRRQSTKTEAGIRIIAVAHPHAVQVLQQRTVGAPAEAQLFPEFRPGGYNAKLSWAPSKAFGRHRDKAGLPRAVDFHSFRRTLITALENLGVDQVRIARYVGHQLPTLAFTLYSGGASEQTMVEVAKVIRYAPEVEQAVAQLVAA